MDVFWVKKTGILQSLLQKAETRNFLSKKYEIQEIFDAKRLELVGFSKNKEFWKRFNAENKEFWKFFDAKKD